MTEELFSVWLFFGDGSYFAEARFIDAESAVRLARAVTLRPAARSGLIVRVIITDGGDCTCFEWTPEAGVTWPEPNQTK